MSGQLSDILGFQDRDFSPKIAPLMPLITLNVYYEQLCDDRGPPHPGDTFWIECIFSLSELFRHCAYPTCSTGKGESTQEFLLDLCGESFFELADQKCKYVNIFYPEKIV